MPVHVYFNTHNLFKWVYRHESTGKTNWCGLSTAGFPGQMCSDWQRVWTGASDEHGGPGQFICQSHIKMKQWNMKTLLVRYDFHLLSLNLSYRLRCTPIQDRTLLLKLLWKSHWLQRDLRRSWPNGDRKEFHSNSKHRVVLRYAASYELILSHTGWWSWFLPDLHCHDGQQEQKE